MENIPLTQYIAQNNYNSAEQIVMANGFNRPDNPQQTLNALNLLLVKKGEPFLDQLADIHPDYELIEKRVREKNNLSNEMAQNHEEKSNAYGGYNTTTNEQRKQMFLNEMQKADEQTSNLDGLKSKANDDKLLKIMLIGSATIISAILIWKIA
jgi:hypothetical protein